MLLCCASTFALVWCLTGRGASTLSRLGTPKQATDSWPAALRSPVDNPLYQVVVCSAAGISVGWVLGGWLSAVAGLPIGAALSWWISRLESPSESRAREEIARDMPLAADLLAACAMVGRPTDEALRVVAAAVGGALGEHLDSVAARLGLGADPLTEWRRLGAEPQFAALARAMARTLESGAPMVDGLSRLAEDRRRERRTQTQLRARNVGVKAAGPLAACFLPAFMLIGVVPTVAGAFSGLVQ